MLKKKDLRRAKNIDPNNKVRLVRALEIIETLGSVPTRQPARSTNFVYIGLKPNDLEKRIYKRLIKRLPGMIREVKKLHKQGLSWKRMFELGLEYRYVSMYVHNYVPKEKMVEKLYTEIKKYSKRQMTWFKRNKNIKWFKPEQYKEIEQEVASRLLK
jgi:tRNA dimethylallyltransferase